MTQRTKAQRRWRKKGYTHEAAYWDAHGKPWNFVLVLRPTTAAYFRKHEQPYDWIRPICPQFIHNGKKPRR